MKVIIPLAGKGTRLRPHTYITPKPLLKVADKPVMSYILDDLRELGVEEVVFITGYLKEKIEDYIRAGIRSSAPISSSSRSRTGPRRPSSSPSRSSTRTC